MTFKEWLIDVYINSLFMWFFIIIAVTFVVWATPAILLPEPFGLCLGTSVAIPLEILLLSYVMYRDSVRCEKELDHIYKFEE